MEISSSAAYLISILKQVPKPDRTRLFHELFRYITDEKERESIAKEFEIGVNHKFTYCVLGTVIGPVKPTDTYEGHQGVFVVQYGIENWGFGELTIRIKQDGTLHVDPEKSKGGMEFAQLVLCELMRRAHVRHLTPDTGPDITPPVVAQEWKHGARNFDLPEGHGSIVMAPECLVPLDKPIEEKPKGDTTGFSP